MGNRWLSRDTRAWIISILLMTVAVRGLIPIGFMPSAEHPFTLKICPDGFPLQLLDERHEAHHHGSGHSHGSHDPARGPHSHDPSLSEHCVFAAAASLGPAPHLPDSVASIEATIEPPLPPPVSPSKARRFCIAQPRAPPSLA